MIILIECFMFHNTKSPLRLQQAFLDRSCLFYDRLGRLAYLLLDQLFMTAPMRLDQYIVDVTNRDRHFAGSAGFD